MFKHRSVPQRTCAGEWIPAVFDGDRIWLIGDEVPTLEEAYGIGNMHILAKDTVNGAGEAVDRRRKGDTMETVLGIAVGLSLALGVVLLRVAANRLGRDLLSRVPRQQAPRSEEPRRDS